MSKFKACQSSLSLFYIWLPNRQRPPQLFVKVGIRLVLVSTLLLILVDLIRKRTTGGQIFLSRFEVMEVETSLQRQRYSSPDKIKTKSSYIPTNCGEPKDVISNLSLRDAYRRATVYIDEDPYNNCCTIEGAGVFKLYLWKATDLPVKITKDKSASSSITFLHFKEMEYLKCSYI